MATLPYRPEASSAPRWCASIRLCRCCMDAPQRQKETIMAHYLERNEFQAARAYSPAVITQGARIVWLAGQTIDKTLRRAGGSVADMVTMTVFINDPRHGDRFVELRGGFFPNGNYPASALITVSHFARPGMLIEIQGVAVIGDEN